MSFQATALQVFIASPGDLPEERLIVEQQVGVWNREHAVGQVTVFIPLAWEWAVATQGHGGQAQINMQQVEQADLVIAMFKSKLGQPTKNYESGTAEEIETAFDQGKQVGVLVCKKPDAPGVYAGDEFDRLGTYLDKIRQSGLTKDFRSDDELKNQVDRILWQACLTMGQNAYLGDLRKRAAEAYAMHREEARMSRAYPPTRQVAHGLARNSESFTGNAQNVSEQRDVSPVKGVTHGQSYKFSRDEILARIVSSRKPFPRTVESVQRHWPEILSSIAKRKRVTLAMLASAAVNAVQDDTIVLEVSNAAMARRVMEPSNSRVVLAAVREVIDDNWQCDVRVNVRTAS